ncbi:MAG: HD domain-containing protein, partial [Bacteroidota bacterium]
QDYLRLEKAYLPLEDWCDEIKATVVNQGVSVRMHCNNKSECEQIQCDPQGLTSLIVNSILLLNKHVESQALEDTPPILFRVEDTRLSYPLEDVKPGYIKYVPAVRIAITVSDDLPVVKDSYSAELNGTSQPPTPKTAEELAKHANSRIVKAHYGYEELTDDTFIYVVPVDVEAVRPKDMDKDYMEVGAMPTRANDHFIDKKRGVDAQAQEATLLADVAARSDANMDMIQTALEAIKWYHGPSKRKSGEPFYLHPLAVAQIVLDYDTDEETIIGALLHDTVEDTPMQLEHIEDRFGKATAEVVNVVTHLQSIPNSIYKVKMSASENLQMLDQAGNKRGLYVKIADRMHNMRTIEGHGKVSKRKLVARETVDFFVPLAEKLGLKKAAQEFEKMCKEVFAMQE